jgi:hypothetical protein
MFLPRPISLLIAVVAAACSDTTAPRRGTNPDLVGPDSFSIVDQAVNPGCHYSWILQAGSAPFTLIGGRMIGLDGTLFNAVPDTFYVWDGETITPLFGTPTFLAGERRQSDTYSTIGDSIQSFDFNTEFDFTGPSGDTGVVRQRISCVRGLPASSAGRRDVREPPNPRLQRRAASTGTGW